MKSQLLTLFAVLTHLHCISWRLLSLLVDAHGHIDRFRPVFVAHKNAVLSRIFCVDLVDGDGAALGLLCDGELSRIEELLVVMTPEDLWRWVAINEAGETQGLKRERKRKNEYTDIKLLQLWLIFDSVVVPCLP